MEAVQQAAALEHPLLPDAWRAFCTALSEVFAAGGNRRPFRWQQPENVRNLLLLLHALTSRRWPHGTLVRDASVALGLDSKGLERRQHLLQSALGWLITGTPFGGPLPLESLGILTSNSRVLFDGPLTLHFADGTSHESRHLRHGVFITAADLDRAERITTTAVRIVSVENSKTTFPRLAAQNESRDTLVIATSFPTQAVRLLLTKLPHALPHWHFGDTDPAGYWILLKLRQLAVRPVRAWLMEWRDMADSPLLSPQEAEQARSLAEAAELADCRDDILRMTAAGRRGDFEQERRACSLPPPGE
jgi:hypothetical protein